MSHIRCAPIAIEKIHQTKPLCVRAWIQEESEYCSIRMLKRVQGASMLFLQTHSIGALLNRFTFDVEIMDLKVPKDVCGRKGKVGNTLGIRVGD